MPLFIEELTFASSEITITIIARKKTLKLPHWNIVCLFVNLNSPENVLTCK